MAWLLMTVYLILEEGKGEGRVSRGEGKRRKDNKKVPDSDGEKYHTNIQAVAATPRRGVHLFIIISTR